jgi:hypothetical protein
MTHDDLGPRPDPKIDPGEPNPGGVDAIDGGDDAEPMVPDLPADKNPAVDDLAAPDELQEGEDTSTQATDDEEPMSGEEESPA